MAAIEPFRKVIVYPALLRSVAAQWNATFGPDNRELFDDYGWCCPKARCAGRQVKRSGYRCSKWSPAMGDTDGPLSG
jgi:hypothetical protein